jgi:hypothetical protein
MARSTLVRAAGLAAAGLLMAAGPAFADDGEILREGASNAIPDSYIVVLDDQDQSRSEANAEITDLSQEADAGAAAARMLAAASPATRVKRRRLDGVDRAMGSP